MLQSPVAFKKLEIRAPNKCVVVCISLRKKITIGRGLDYRRDEEVRSESLARVEQKLGGVTSKVWSPRALIAGSITASSRVLQRKVAFKALESACLERA